MSTLLLDRVDIFIYNLGIEIRAACILAKAEKFPLFFPLRKGETAKLKNARNTKPLAIGTLADTMIRKKR